jgi:hypothetical protein
MLKVTVDQFGGHVPLCRSQWHPVNKSGSRLRSPPTPFAEPILF